MAEGKAQTAGALDAASCQRQITITNSQDRRGFDPFQGSFQREAVSREPGSVHTPGLWLSHSHSTPFTWVLLFNCCKLAQLRVP